MLPFQPVKTKTKAQRQAESYAAEQARRQRLEAEYERQRELPSLEDKVQAIGDALTTLLSVVHHQAYTHERVDPAKIQDITEELLRVLNKETRCQ